MRTRAHVSLLVVLIAAAGGYTGVSWWIGTSIERRLQQSEQQLLDSANYLTLVSRTYRRGVFSSTEDLTYGLGGSLAKDPRAALMLSVLTLTVHNTIEHGPLPGFRSTVALAAIDSQLRPPAALQQVVETILNGQPLLHAHVIVHWSGDSDGTFDSPDFHYRFPDGSRIAWYGISGTGRGTSSMAHWSGQISAPGLMLDGPSGRFELRDLAFNGDMQRALDTFYVGRSDMRLGSVTAHAPNGTAFSVQGIRLQSDSGVNAGYLDQHISLSADRLDLAQLSLSRIGYVMTLSHLHAESFAALIAALRDAQHDLGSSASTAAQASQLTVLSRYGLELASHQPVLNIERIGFAAPEGEFRASGKLTVPGLSQQDLQSPAAMAALMMHLDVTADLRIDAPLLDQLLVASGQHDLVGSQLEQLERQRYLRRDGNAFTSSLAYHAGALTINGLPYRPMGGTRP